MLGKLLKQEFRATGRLMLPAFAALLLLSVLANGSLRLIDRGVVNNRFLYALFVFVIIAFGLGIFGILLMTLVMMVLRFYRNLLKDEGYLMHTLPVTVHGLVWSKLLTSLVWFVVSGLVVALILFLTGVFQTGTDLSALFRQLPSWAEIREMLAAQGVAVGELGGLFAQILAIAVVTVLTNCLHFYAAMAMGHMFNKDKVLLSVVFYVAISVVLSLLMNVAGLRLANDLFDGVEVSFRQVRSMLWMLLGWETLQGALMYFAATFSLRRGLNLG